MPRSTSVACNRIVSEVTSSGSIGRIVSAPGARSRFADHACQRRGTHPRCDIAHVVVMPRIERRMQMLRLQIADQRNPPMTQRHTLFKQRDRGLRIAGIVCAPDEFGGVGAGHRRWTVPGRRAAQLATPGAAARASHAS